MAIPENQFQMFAFSVFLDQNAHGKFEDLRPGDAGIGVAERCRWGATQSHSLIVASVNKKVSTILYDLSERTNQPSEGFFPSSNGEISKKN